MTYFLEMVSYLLLPAYKKNVMPPLFSMEGVGGHIVSPMSVCTCPILSCPPIRRYVKKKVSV